MSSDGRIWYKDESKKDDSTEVTVYIRMEGKVVFIPLGQLVTIFQEELMGKEAAV